MMGLSSFEDGSLPDATSVLFVLSFGAEVSESARISLLLLLEEEQDS